MKTTLVSYEKLFPLGPYINEKIRIEGTLEEGETVEQAFTDARKMVHDFHHKTNPELYAENNMRGTVISDVPEPVKKKLSNEEKKAETINSTIQVINTAENIGQVEIFRKLVNRENIPALTEAFENAIKKFTK